MRKKEIKRPVTMTLTPSVIEYLDKIARRDWMNRSSYIDKMIGMMMEKETKEESTNE